MRSRALVVAIVAALAASGCGVHGLSFVQDKRVDIIRPADRAKVHLPTTIDWTVKNFEAGPGRGSFGVLVDQAPPRSGKSLSFPFRGNTLCKRAEGQRMCATSEFLSQQGVFQTFDSSFTVRQVSRLTGDQRRRQFHEVTIVLLDAAGNRLGEGAWSVQLEVQGQRF